MAASTKYEPDTMVVYCLEGDEVLARVTEVHPETGEVIGLAVYDQDGKITGGVSNPLPAAIPQHRITHGYFWRR